MQINHLLKLFINEIHLSLICGLPIHLSNTRCWRGTVHFIIVFFFDGTSRLQNAFYCTLYNYHKLFRGDNAFYCCCYLDGGALPFIIIVFSVEQVKDKSTQLVVGILKFDFLGNGYLKNLQLFNVDNGDVFIYFRKVFHVINFLSCNLYISFHF